MTKTIHINMQKVWSLKIYGYETCVPLTLLCDQVRELYLLCFKALPQRGGGLLRAQAGVVNIIRDILFFLVYFLKVKLQGIYFSISAYFFCVFVVPINMNYVVLLSFLKSDFCRGHIVDDIYISNCFLARLRKGIGPCWLMRNYVSQPECLETSLDPRYLTRFSDGEASFMLVVLKEATGGRRRRPPVAV